MKWKRKELLEELRYQAELAELLARRVEQLEDGLEEVLSSWESSVSKHAEFKRELRMLIKEWSSEANLLNCNANEDGAIALYDCAYDLRKLLESKNVKELDDE